MITPLKKRHISEENEESADEVITDESVITRPGQKRLKQKQLPWAANDDM